MTVTNLIRYAYFAFFGFGVAFMLATNFMSFQVLRPPARMGFVWWHVSAISVSFLCFGVVIMEGVSRSLGSGLTWRTYVVGVGVLTFFAAQIIIFNVERQRWINKKALALGIEQRANE